MKDPSIQSFAFLDEQLLFIPDSISINPAMAFLPLSLERSLLHTDDLPSTMQDFFDFIINWQQIYPDLYEEGFVSVISPDPFDLTLTLSMNAYVNYYENQNMTLIFDTPLFRELLIKSKAASMNILTQQDENILPILFPSGSNGHKSNSIFLPLKEDQPSYYNSQINGYIIHVNSRNKEEAMRYVLSRITAVSQTQQILLWPGAYEAIEHSGYTTRVKEIEEERKLIEKSMERSESEIEKRVYRDKISILAEQKKEADNNRYLFTSEEIERYQGVIAPNLRFPFNSIVSYGSHLNEEALALIKRFRQGSISDEYFIEILEQQQRLRRLEDM